MTTTTTLLKVNNPIQRWDSIAPGLVPLTVGDVLMLGGEYVVTLVNECRARCVALTRERVASETMGGKHFSFLNSPKVANISPHVEPRMIVRRLPTTQLFRYLPASEVKAAHLPAGQPTDSGAEESEDDSMNKTKNSTGKPRARGGLVAEAQRRNAAAKGKTPKTPKTPKAKKAPKEKKAGNPALFDRSVCAFLRVAAHGGATMEECTAYLKKHGIDSAEPTIATNVRKGKAGKELGEPLTKEQLSKVKGS